MSTSIKKKPNKTVSNLVAPTRGYNDHRMTSAWKVPASMTKDSSDSRATELIVTWKFNFGKKPKKLTKTVGTSVVSSTVNLNSLKIGSKTYNRSSFYPNSGKPRLTSVSISVQGKNSKGKGKAVTQTRKFLKPRKPTVDPITFNTSNGHCVTTVKTNAGTDYNERYDTYYRVTVITRDGETITPTTGVTVTSGQSVYHVPERALTSTEFTVEYDVSGYQSLPPDKFIMVSVEAWARGYAGDSEPTKRVYYVSKPKPATITGMAVSSKGSTGIFTAYIDTNQTKQYPVDTVKLEYLSNTTYENASDIPAREEWDESGIEDNGDCTALSVPLSIDKNFVPDRGKYTWVRVKSFHANEAVLYTYSEYKRVEALETPPASQVEDSISIISARAGSDGESAVVLLGWNASGMDDSTGTELSWSTEEDAWRSTKEPESFEFTWTDGVYPKTGEVEYHDSAEIVIKGLSEGTKYYIKARRFYDGETIAYGNYSNDATVLTSEKPSSVVANCNKYLTAGEPLPIYWTFSGKGIQTEWSVEASSGTTIDYGEGSVGSARISWDRVSALAEDNSITFRVWVSTGSEPKESEWHTVLIREKPTLSLTAPTTLTEQPYSFTAESNRLCDLIVIVTAQGASGQFPEGDRLQARGDTVYSGYGEEISAVWEEGSATVTLPEGLDFWDLGSYTLSVVAVDRETDLRSEQVVADFTVEWENQAVDPDDAITLMPMDYTTDSGAHVQAVQITLTPPTGCSETDVYDIYRMDGENAHLIGEGFPLTHTVIDEYAPFGDNEDLFYRIALRTVDGDVEFADKEYELISNTVRFDWRGGSLELPYGITVGDSYSKSVEFRQHMDGSVDGYWNENVERKASYNSSIIKLIQPDEVNLARQLARYAGAVFVRTANGSAFTADVQVTDLSIKNKAVTTIAIDATEVEITDEFMLPSPYELEDE